MGKLIQDRFTSRTDVSRQRRYQLRKQSQGKCMICGKRATSHKCLCEYHRKVSNTRQMRNRKRK